MKGHWKAAFSRQATTTSLSVVSSMQRTEEEWSLIYSIQNFENWTQGLLKILVTLLQSFLLGQHLLHILGFFVLFFFFCVPFTIWERRMGWDILNSIFPLHPGGWKQHSRKEKLKLSHDDLNPISEMFLYIRYNELGNEIQRAGTSEGAN